MRSRSELKVYVATVIFEDRTKAMKEFLIFRDVLNELHEAVDSFKRRLAKNGCRFAASIIETLEEHFEKENIVHDREVTFH
jgi:hypothetical protein